MTIGEKIVERRKLKKYSQEKLAEMVDVSRQTLHNWESDITSPDLGQVQKLCEIFEISMDELIGNNIEGTLLNRTSKLESKYSTLNNLVKTIIIIIILFAIVFMPILLYLFLG